MRRGSVWGWRRFVSVVEAVPPARATEGYVSAIDKLCRRYQIDALIPASEAEISVLSRIGPRLACSAAIVCQPWEWIQVFGTNCAACKP